MTKSQSRGPRKPWTESEVALLTRLYPDTPTAEIAVQLGISICRVSRKSFALGLKKSAAYQASPAACRLRKGSGTGFATRFKPGLTPWNKGKSFIAGGKSAETRFKVGNRTGEAKKNYQPIGAERLSKDGYRERKINDDFPISHRWRAEHIMLWEATHGRVPKGCVVIFKDGNKSNVTLENLELVTRAELMARNSVHNYGPEIAQLTQLHGKIAKQLNRRTHRVE